MGRAARRRKRPDVREPDDVQRVIGEQPLPLAVQAPAVTTATAPEPDRPARRAPLLDLRRVQRRLADLERETDDLVDAAHLAGHSYAEIGAALGVSRQAARQRHLRRA